MFTRSGLAQNKIRGPDWSGRSFVAEVLGQAGDRIDARGIPGTDFVPKSGNGGLNAPVLMEEGI